MRTEIVKTAKHVLDKCAVSPLFLATGASGRRFLHLNGQPAVTPIKGKDGQGSIDGDIELLQVMASAPEMHAAIEDILEVIDIPELNPAIKSRVINMKLVLAKANNLNGDNTIFILENKLELCRSELQVAGKDLINSPFVKVYAEKYKERYGELNQEIIDRTIANVSDDISYDKNGFVTIVDGNYLEKAILKHTLKNSKYAEILNRTSF